MPATWVYTCTGTRGENTSALNPAEMPTCTPASSGQWIQVESLSQPFDPVNLDADQLASAFGVGFVTLATGLLLAWAVRIIVSSVKSF